MMIKTFTKQEYSAKLIIPLSTIIDVVEIDGISKNKKYCMQIILAQSKKPTFRFSSGLDEEALMQCLGGIKSRLAVLSHRRDLDLDRDRGGHAAAAAGMGGNM